MWLTLRRLSDVLLTLIPLILAGVVTLELCVLIDLPLNYANIIALPLLLGVGVAFKIYYIMAWREGQTNLLQSVLTRAVISPRGTTATAFGSLFFSATRAPRAWANCWRCRWSPPLRGGAVPADPDGQAAHRGG